MAVAIVVQREESVIAWLGYPELQTQLFILAFATGLIWLLESRTEPPMMQASSGTSPAALSSPGG